MGGFFFGKFVFAIPLLILVFKLLPHLPLPCEKVGGAFFFGINFYVLPYNFIGDIFLFLWLASFYANFKTGF
jgi:hypothetical protein